MTTQSNYLSSISSRITLFHVVLFAAALLITGCYADKKTSTTTIDMVVVFNKNVPIEKASSIMFEHEYIFLEGMDNSKGKKYFQETGPKYIVKVPKEKIDAFNSEMKTVTQIHEIYRADYSVNKD